MRIHANSKSEDYWLAHYAKSPDVLLNGVKMTNVIVADDCEGYVEIYLCDAEGEPLFDAARERFATKLIAGKVEIIGERRVANA